MNEPDRKLKAAISMHVPDDVVRSANDFLQRIVGPVAEAADLLSDKLRFVRFRSAIKTLEKARALVEEREIELNELPAKFLVPFLETCSIEDENSELIDRWAALLASAAEDNKKNLTWCIRILGEIHPRQAHVLDTMYARSPSSRPSDVYTRRQAEDEFVAEIESLKRLPLSEVEQFLGAQYGLSLFFEEDDIPNTNEFHLVGFEDGEDLLQLESLGLVWVFASWVFIQSKKHFYIRSFLSPLGTTFVEACSKSEDVWPGRLKPLVSD